MSNWKIRNSKALTSAAKIGVAIAALIILAPAIRNMDSISSDEVDALLYQYLDRYNQTIRDNPDFAAMIITAESDPDALGTKSRERYLTYQRKFFAEWDVAWTYYRTGQLDTERWNTWNSWFAEEARRRPLFGWVENREHFSDSFVLHVDDYVGISYD